MKSRSPGLKKPLEPKVYLSDPVELSYFRDGCGISDFKRAVFVQSEIQPDNSHNLRTHFIVFIHDLDKNGVRTLEVIGLKRLSVKSEFE